MRDTSRPALGALTGARFLAALWVVLYHYFFAFQSPPRTATELIPGTSLMNPLLLLFWQGHLAVDFFFLLSGFILAYTYLAADGSARGGKRAFWVARIARIYPVYLLGLLLGMEPYLVSGHRLFGVGTSAVASLFLLQAWVPSTLGWNQPAWSLSVEAFFYLLFPLLLPLVAHLSRRGLWRVVAGAWAVFAAIILVLYLLGLHYATLWWWGDFVRYNPLVSLPEFLVGMTLGLLFVRSEGVLGLDRWSDRGLNRAIAVVATLLLALLLIASATRYSTGDLDSMAVFVLPFLAVLDRSAGVRSWDSRTRAGASADALARRDQLRRLYSALAGLVPAQRSCRLGAAPVGEQSCPVRRVSGAGAHRRRSKFRLFGAPRAPLHP